jgi:hypothetical protein
MTDTDDYGLIVVRHPVTDRFTTFANDTIRDGRLSFRATGVLVHVVSLPDGARINATVLAASRDGEGRDAVRAALRELEHAGYLRREQHQDNVGRWRTLTVVSDTPFATPETDFQAPGLENRESVDRASVNQALKAVAFKEPDRKKRRNRRTVDNGPAAPPNGGGPVRTDKDGRTFLPGTGWLA